MRSTQLTANPKLLGEDQPASSPAMTINQSSLPNSPRSHFLVVSLRCFFALDAV